MHEFSLAQDVINIVSQSVPLQDEERVVLIKVKAGVLKMLTQESLQRAFDILSNGTALSGAKIVFEEVPGNVLEVEYVETE